MRPTSLQVFKIHMACYFMDATVFEDIQEIQPWCRITATTSQSHNELSTNVPYLEAVQGVWWGCGPEQLAAKVPCARVYSGTLNTPSAPAEVLEIYI